MAMHSRNDRHPCKVAQSFILSAIAGIAGGIYEHIWS